MGLREIGTSLVASKTWSTTLPLSRPTPRDRLFIRATVKATARYKCHGGKSNEECDTAYDHRVKRQKLAKQLDATARGKAPRFCTGKDVGDNKIIVRLGDGNFTQSLHVLNKGNLIPW